MNQAQVKKIMADAALNAYVMAGGMSAAAYEAGREAGLSQEQARELLGAALIEANERYAKGAA